MMSIKEIKDLNKLQSMLKSTQEELKYVKRCCEEAGFELAKNSFDWDGKEKNLVVQAINLNEKLQTKEQECEELKKGVIEQCPNCGEQYLNQIGAELYEECEALKKQLKQQEALTETYKACYRAKHNDVKDEFIKLKQIIDEIKEYCELDNIYYDDLPFRTQMDDILDIIKKAKE